MIAITVVIIIAIAIFFRVGIITRVTHATHVIPSNDNDNEKHINNDRVIRGNTIWMLWLDGFDTAPWIVKKVHESWVTLNSGWDVVVVDRSSLSTYLPGVHILETIGDAAKSDVVRLHLLAKYGGVWADASMLCMVPLDLYIYDALAPSNFWMYHGVRGPASWFMVSTVNACIPRKWAAASDAFWSTYTGDAYDYFWMDSLFVKLLQDDDEFAQEWSRVPYLSCEDPGQSHMLATTWGNVATPENLEIFMNRPPYAVKLNRRLDMNSPGAKDTNAYAALMTNNVKSHYYLHAMTFKESSSSTKKIIPKRYVIVAADCGNSHSSVKDMAIIQQLADANNLDLIIYDKCNFCKEYPTYKCSPLPNLGREMMTFLYYIMTNYDDLPDKIFLFASNLNKYDRLARLKDLVRDKTPGCTAGALGHHADFTLPEYEGRRMILADARPLKKWYEKHVGPFDPADSGPCWNGLMWTSRERILKRPLHVYKDLYAQFTVGEEVEAGHFMERIMSSVF
jgi:hypothetical protein